jgi:lipopolysaccharide transport system ATP-binding protein
LSDVAIRVHDVSKSFRLRHEVRRDTLREVISRACTALFHRNQRAEPPSSPSTGPSRSSSEEFWALKGASFETTRGEVLGIVGRNGLDSSDPLKRGQGYLLLTVGYHADTLTVSTA